jgi:hypothetical protein
MSEITNNQTENLNPILKGTIVKCEYVTQAIAPSNLKRIFYHSIETDTEQVFTIGCEDKNPKKLQAGSEIEFLLYGNGKGKLISSNQTEESFDQTLKPHNMDFIELKGIKFHKIDEDNDIEIEVDGWGHWISIEETEKLIEFLNTQIVHKKEKNKS